MKHQNIKLLARFIPYFFILQVFLYKKALTKEGLKKISDQWIKTYLFNKLSISFSASSLFCVLPSSFRISKSAISVAKSSLKMLSNLI